ncbi:hypothetical protein GCM10012280_58480 [Wenjunlia tyrosinilytica]|uniref:Uncharacterized protein n=1 Tax=Wenjunlia tyrosinilytica TaxID=1544741 RepID=A0A917ZWB7_9ACTN|nr:hypothetical protein GCM10012280_58480 [Wenjunlia tyrosinilytica]
MEPGVREIFAPGTNIAKVVEPITGVDGPSRALAPGGDLRAPGRVWLSSPLRRRLLRRAAG